MLTHSLEWGRLGNQLFCIAGTIGIAKSHGREFAFPEWVYSEYFKHPLAIRNIAKKDKIVPVGESSYNYTPEYWTKALMGEKISIEGWLQSEKYFEACKEDIREQFRWKDEFRRDLKNKHSHFSNGRDTIAISIRKGKDYEDNGNYEILPITYYILALEEFFPDWRENFNVMIFSDEMSYAKSHFQGDNIFYAEGTDIEQLCLMSLCDDFILANSTFSWWGAWLGEKEFSVILRPAHYFKGELLRTHNTTDLWPERWRAYDHKDKRGENKKIQLKDITFTIPVCFDHEDREQNLLLSIEHLKNWFDTNIMVGEQGGQYFQNKIVSDGYTYWNTEYMPEFHRTRMLNDMANAVTTLYIANWDADIFIPPLQILNAVYLLRRGKVDVIYPYDGRFARVERKWYKILKKDLDTGVFKDQVFMGTREEDAKSVGGAIFFNKESFVYGGMENEYMISYGPEDVERFERFNRLGYSVGRIRGILYHLDHYVGPNSSDANTHFINNNALLTKEEKMTDEELLEYVDSWPWVKKYSDKYYENILEDAVQSGKEILQVVHKMFPHIHTVLDVSGGVGEFAEGANLEGFEYTLTDFRISKTKLLVPERAYKEHDLRQPNSLFPISSTFDLVINTEVGEHLHEDHSNGLIELLTSKGEIILFSAAIPYQGGLFHVNEQWQSYWAEKFEKYGYFPYKYDIRQILRDIPQVSNWYKQNIIIYTKYQYPIDYKLNYVLPEQYINVIEHYKRKTPV